MQIKKLATISYDTIAKRLKNNTISAAHDPKGLSVIHATPKYSPVIEPDIYVFEKDVLISKDVTSLTKDGGIRRTLTNFYKNRRNTTVSEYDASIGEFIKRTYDKTMFSLKQIRRKQKYGFIKEIIEKIKGKKVDSSIPVSISKTKLQVADQEAQTTYNVLIRGKKDKVRITGTKDSVFVFAKGNGFEQWYDFGAYGSPEKPETINKILNWFIDANKRFQ